MAPTRTVSVLVVSNYALLRQGLATVLESQRGIEVVGDATPGHDAVQTVVRLLPNIVLIDVVSPGVDGAAMTRLFRKAAPNTNVVLIGGRLNEDKLLESMRAGASGYLTATSGISELLLAIQAVSLGNRYFSNEVGESFDLDHLWNQAKQSELRTGLAALSDRELEVLQLFGEGYSNSMVADELSIAVSTVEAHHSKITKKLRIRGTTNVIEYAVGKGIASMPSAYLE
jgi:NarL family two-component system response regulator LiaR